MLTDFYVAISTVCFTLLGLWIIVVQTRHGEWRHSAVHRRRAYAVALHFSAVRPTRLTLSCFPPVPGTCHQLPRQTWR